MNYRDKDWKESMLLEFDWTFFDAQLVGEEHGISEKDLEMFYPEGEKILKNLLESKKDLAFWDILEKPSILEEVKDVGAFLKAKDFENILVLGIGGSALGTICIFKSLCHPFHNHLKKPRLFVMDNIDPLTFGSLLDMISLERTLVVVVSKSGTTAETMSQFMIVKDRIVKAFGKDSLKNHVVAITDPNRGILREIVKEFDLISCVVPPALGGRFSVLSAVGLLPSFLVGVDIDSLWEGASFASQKSSISNLADNRAVLNGLYHIIFDLKKKKPIQVYWAYSDGLYYFADWLRQLIAESLGKRRKDGTSVGVTPIKALGATDQHSQLQLYREGPNDKVITFLGIKRWSRDVDIPLEENGKLYYLGGHSLGKLLHAEQKATACALVEAGRPNMTLWFPELNSFTLGEAFFFYELQTAFIGYFYGIDPFDQPGVELSKNMTYGLMGRKGFERFAEMVERFSKWRK